MKYFKIEAVMALTDEETEWDSHCDETFGLASVLGPSDGPVIMTAHQEISFEEFIQQKNTIFTDEGGI